MLLETEGIVLNSIKYSESSLITSLFSEKNGLISLISSRGKSKKNKSHIFQMPFSLVHVICYYKPNQNIHRIKDIQFNNDYIEDSSHVVKNSIRYFIAELLSKIIREEEQNQELYRFLKAECLKLNASEKINPHFLLQFLTSLLSHLGFQPQMNYHNNNFDLEQAEFSSKGSTGKAYLNNEESRLFAEVFTENYKFNKIERNQTLNNLLKYLGYQLDQEIKLKSKEVLEVVFA